jgi:hypothetical protein
MTTTVTFLLAGPRNLPFLRAGTVYRDEIHDPGLT